VTDTILVVDNEPDILRFIEINLLLEGFGVVEARDGAEALDLAAATLPALVLLDVSMPGLDGFEVCRRLRADTRTSHIPVIFLTARSMTVDKVVGLTAGADDYVLKPFDPVELVARVRTTLARTSQLREISPLTGLPGNHRIVQEAGRRLAAGDQLAMIHADLNSFKAFNDRYGFLRGDDVILMTAEILQAAVRDHGATDAFLGHVGGDDFVLLCHPDDVEALCKQAVGEFDDRIGTLYDPDDLARGGLELLDRQGTLHRFPVMTIALGVATTARRTFTDARALAQVATEMKNFLKQRRRHSAWAVDERSDRDG
jgi:DNA-binding response OmpR family regulator